MITLRLKLAALWRRFHRDQDGTVAVIMAIATVVIVGMMGFAIDVGHVLLVQRDLQASSDAAALAGAWQIPNDTAASPNTAVNAADNYASESGDKNAVAGITATMVSGYPLLKCLPNLAKTLFCEGPGTGANAIQVEQQAVVPMFFAKIFGIKTMTVTTLSTAAARGGTGQHLNVMIVLDATNSMSQQDANCGLSKEQCALEAVQDLLIGLNPQLDYVGLEQFPQVSAAEGKSDCSVPSNAAYGSASPATFVDANPVNSFASGSGGSGNLTSTSPIVEATGGGGKGCQGLSASPQGGFASDAADAIAEAQATLVAFNTANNLTNQNVIILLSDGEYNADSGDFATIAKTNVGTSTTDPVTGKVTLTGLPNDEAECQLTIDYAQAAAAAGTWVYSVAYDSDPTKGSGTQCTTDKAYGPLAGISSCTTMQDIASSPAFFYSSVSTGSNGCPSQNNYTSLASIFSNISANLTEPRLIPDNTT